MAGFAVGRARCTQGNRRARAVRLAPLAVVVLAGSCAKQGIPPGGPEDNRPPVVVATEPEGLATVPDFTGPVRFDFDERISERAANGDLDDAVVVSPRTGRVRVGHGRRSLEVNIEDGFQQGIVYRVTLLPAISDLFGNVTVDAFELVFSTGPDPAHTVVAGTTWNRVTGASASDHEVLATPLDRGEGELTAPHVARADRNGLYALRFVPAGRYRLTAYRDRDRDGEVGVMEGRGDMELTIGAADTIFANLAVLPADTTPSVLLAASSLDSITVLIEFDDHMDAELRQDVAEASVERDADSVALAVSRVFTELEYTAYASALADSIAVDDSLFAVEQARLDSIAAVEQARLDSIAAVEQARLDSIAAVEQARLDSIAEAAGDSTVVVMDSAEVADPAGATIDSVTGDADPEVTPSDEVEAAEDTIPPRPRPPVGIDGRPASRPPPPDAPPLNPGPRGPDGERLPTLRMVIVLADPLEAGTVYSMIVSGVVNLNRIPGGGGRVSFAVEADSTEGR